MKKILLLFIPLLFSCASDGDSTPTSTDPNPNDATVLVRGENYFLEKAYIVKKQLGEETTQFSIELCKGDLTYQADAHGYTRDDNFEHTLYFNIVYRDGSNDLESGTFSHLGGGVNHVGGVAFMHSFSGDSKVTAFDTEDIPVNTPDVTITKNSATNYTFHFYFDTVYGLVEGVWSGEVIKLGF